MSNEPPVSSIFYDLGYLIGVLIILALVLALVVGVATAFMYGVSWAWHAGAQP